MLKVRKLLVTFLQALQAGATGGASGALGGAVGTGLGAMSRTLDARAGTEIGPMMCTGYNSTPNQY